MCAPLYTPYLWTIILCPFGNFIKTYNTFFFKKVESFMIYEFTHVMLKVCVKLAALSAYFFAF